MDVFQHVVIQVFGSIFVTSVALAIGFAMTILGFLNMLRKSQYLSSLLYISGGGAFLYLSYRLGQQSPYASFGVWAAPFCLLILFTLGSRTLQR